MASAPHPKTPAAGYGMLPVPEALDIVLKHTTTMPSETISIADAFGRVLAHDVHAQEPVPPFPASIKDGYAVCSADGPGEYAVAFEAYAGSAPPALQRGTVAYIGTGGPVPQGADAVVQIEDTTPLPPSPDNTRRVHITRASYPGEDIRPIGSDVAAGELVLPTGTVLGAAEIGILATVGAVTVETHTRPVVAVLSTGDEVQDPTTPINALQYGKIRDANRHMLLAAAGGVLGGGAGSTLDLGIAGDDGGVLEGCLERAIDQGADVLLTTGGVSMGDKDLIKGMLEARGEVFFGKVLMKPGKPLTFAKLQCPGRSPLLVFGLPGNPNPHLQRIHVVTSTPLKLDPQRPEYHRARVQWQPPRDADKSDSGDDVHNTGGQNTSGRWVAHSTGGQISSRLLSMRSATVLLELPQQAGTLPAGSVVSALVIGDLHDT